MKKRIKYSNYIEFIDKDKDYIESLSLKILSTIDYMYSLPIYYKEYKEYLIPKSKDYILILDLSFNELREFLWLKFVNQMREYITILFELFKNKNYLSIENYVKNETNFVGYFLGKSEYSTLSFSLHNHSKIEFFGNEQHDSCWKILSNHFNNAFKNNNIQNIRVEFEKIISLFRKIHDLPVISIELDYCKNRIIFELIKLLSNTKI